jgi:hypothetical protein
MLKKEKKIGRNKKLKMTDYVLFTEADKYLIRSLVLDDDLRFSTNGRLYIEESVRRRAYIARQEIIEMVGNEQE